MGYEEFLKENENSIKEGATIDINTGDFLGETYMLLSLCEDGGVIDRYIVKEEEKNSIFDYLPEKYPEYLSPKLKDPMARLYIADELEKK